MIRSEKIARPMSSATRPSAAATLRAICVSPTVATISPGALAMPAVTAAMTATMRKYHKPRIIVPGLPRHPLTEHLRMP